MSLEGCFFGISPCLLPSHTAFVREELGPTKSMVVDDPQYPGQPFLPVVYWSFYLFLGSTEATVFKNRLLTGITKTARAVKIPGGLWFSMPSIRCLRVSVNGWRLLHKCKKCQVPRAYGVVLFCFVVGNTMIVVMKWDPFDGNQISSLNEW